ncbi:teicoplanin resistance protein VanZ [Lentzea aerocolonigenes]|uniref:Teicoplanin resistance protein VanZ n=1 Tax=Lentzea aerocolonigenes TaxID=68170 RepID=A0A0F0HAQ6_LENAE|nr:teicoplanin resistance protein VanZ [Lentzea aerocolonigenes]
MLNNWYDWVGTFTGVVALAVLSLPIAVVTAGLLGWRRKVTGAAHPWRTAVAEVGLVYGTVPWVWMTLLPGNEPGKHGVVTLVPLADLLSWDRGQIIGNLLIFAPLGFFAPLRFSSLASLGHVLMLAAGCSTFIEVAQYVLLLDRVSSVDDVLLNTVGAGLASMLSYRWWRTPVHSFA